MPNPVPTILTSTADPSNPQPLPLLPTTVLHNPYLYCRPQSPTTPTSTAGPSPSQSLPLLPTQVTHNPYLYCRLIPHNPYLYCRPQSPTISTPAADPSPPQSLPLLLTPVLHNPYLCCRHCLGVSVVDEVDGGVVTGSLQHHAAVEGAVKRSQTPGSGRGGRTDGLRTAGVSDIYRARRTLQL